MTYNCPRCGTWVTTLYVDTAGQHWVCPNCQRNSDNYTLRYDYTTLTLKEEDIQNEHN